MVAERAPLLRIACIWCMVLFHGSGAGLYYHGSGAVLRYSFPEIYTRRNSHKNTWDFFQVCLALSLWID